MKVTGRRSKHPSGGRDAEMSSPWHWVTRCEKLHAAHIDIGVRQRGQRQKLSKCKRVVRWCNTHTRALARHKPSSKRTLQMWGWQKCQPSWQCVHLNGILGFCWNYRCANRCLAVMLWVCATVCIFTCVWARVAECACVHAFTSFVCIFQMWCLVILCVYVCTICVHLSMA